MSGPNTIRLRPRRHRPSQCRVERAVTLPQDQAVLDPLVKLAVCHEFQIDVHGRRPIESDEETRLADVLAGEAGKQRPQAGREGGGRRGAIRAGARRGSHDEVQVREFVRGPGGG
jgi:hypothetical protein